ncbi:Methionine ABC transporter ATP-binding protein [[Actinomadura] parvosata subsp. kistnae]|uniref:Multidrug ABC transporter ATP-binding protein n=1 Tax=[Actinomadura] parvosata subsp. kistnae TaxID=1909395 RepID=A0A1V0A287_9ACTN|nr:ATP-binding cassette domain-containing protein [Nonomuraea sp. ATCC 55076]AQZ64320.1 multidrug ABC transporter ATP-binding protein [Nonomuraea sp. ATCC 55076]SPL89087.1 Methionine ABC transporter ATP-binding protein [Actinomadura parvosata subsp. kistnae]
MISLKGLTKRYGDRLAVDDLTLELRPGAVTGFLGPNGAGKSTTMRLVLGLDRPTAGTALVGGVPYRKIRNPLRTVGALLDARAVHPGRSGRAHLVALARSNGIPRRRVEEVLETVGMAGAARKRAGTLSLGMSQRLGIAAALLGDPEVLMFDEPVNGLDPDGVRWVRGFMRSLAAEGRTVFVSSHLMSEMQLTADHLVVIGKGRLITDAPLADVLAGSSLTAVLVRTPHAGDLAALLRRAGMAVERCGENELEVTGAAIERVGDLAHEAGIRLHELRAKEASLEQAYQELTSGSVEYGVGA